MICPNCEKELIVVERNSIELDYCLSCKGLWFDNNEWDLLAQKLGLGENSMLGDIYSIPKVIVKENSKKCPICGKTMEKFMLNGHILDRCVAKHGVWFDSDELSGVINANAKYGNSAPVCFLGEIFYSD